MREAGIIIVILAFSAVGGCLEESNEFTCPDGTQSSGPGACPRPEATTTSLSLSGSLKECSLMEEGEYRSACFTNLAIDSSDLSICDKLDNMTWVRYCYGKLNMSQLLPPEETTTTMPEAAVSSIPVTPTTLADDAPCGNGVLDPGEDCDIGKTCLDAEGICMITPQEPHLAVCRYNMTCEWETQVAVVGRYAMGGCNGCFGRNSTQACRCIQQTVLNISGGATASVGAMGSAPSTSGRITHTECVDGLCRRADGKGVNGCSSDSECRHKECAGGSCVLVMSPGASVCTSNDQCI